jgi:hypothetical protein
MGGQTRDERSITERVTGWVNDMKERSPLQPANRPGLDPEVKREVSGTSDPSSVEYGGRPGNGQGDDNGFDFFKKKK